MQVHRLAPSPGLQHEPACNALIVQSIGRSGRWAANWQGQGPEDLPSSAVRPPAAPPWRRQGARPASSHCKAGCKVGKGTKTLHHLRQPLGGGPQQRTASFALCLAPPCLPPGTHGWAADARPATCCACARRPPRATATAPRCLRRRSSIVAETLLTGEGRTNPGDGCWRRVGCGAEGVVDAGSAAAITRLAGLCLHTRGRASFIEARLVPLSTPARRKREGLWNN